MGTCKNRLDIRYYEYRFHSINVPSEWGLHKFNVEPAETWIHVSIQLMSPASGDFLALRPRFVRAGFPFN